jgi:hypothetical protein
MLYTQQGQVSDISTKPFTDKWNKQITLYSFQLAGDNRWYRTGKVAPACNVGDSISFVFDQVGNNCNVQAQSIVGGSAAAVPVPAPAAAAPAQSAPPAPAPAAPAAGGKNFQARRPSAPSAKDDYWANKEAYDKEVTQPRIAFAAAQKSAIEIVGLALQHDLLSLGTAKKADKLDLILAYVDELTGKLALRMQSAGQILEELAQKGTADLHAASAGAAADTEDNMYGDE